MGTAQDGKAAARQAVKLLERELFKANNLLRQCAPLKESLAAVKENASKLEEISSKDPVISGALQGELAQTKIFQSFAELSANISGLSKAMKDFEEAQLKAELFLESYVGSRTYAFSDSAKAAEFANKAFELYSASTVFFKPEIMGIIDVGKIASELRLEKKDAQYLKVPSSEINGLFSFLSKNGIAKNFCLDSGEIRLLFKNSSTVKAETDSAKIKRLDRLAKTLEGSYQ